MYQTSKKYYAKFKPGAQAAGVVKSVKGKKKAEAKKQAPPATKTKEKAKKTGTAGK